MYEFHRPQDGEFILRVGHSHRRTPQMIAGEIDWINYLARGGAHVSRAILSKHGKLVEAIDDGHGEQFLATAFIKAPGRPSWETEWTPEFVEHYGQVIGRIHQLTKDYIPYDPSWRRPEWDTPGNMNIPTTMPASEMIALQKFWELMRHFETLPKDREGYGLIHQDAHSANFFVKDGVITLFDFDDCVYSWFIYDIAMVLFYAAMGSDDKAAFTQDFMRAFLHGYSQENPLDPRWLREIPRFLKLREIDLFGLIQHDFGMEYLDDPWCAGYMKGRKDLIDNDVPYIEFDWDSLAEYL